MKLFQILFATLLAILLQRQGIGEDRLSTADLAGLSFVQKNGAQISLNSEFIDENGKHLRLNECLGTGPTILTLGYYECPMLCNLVLNGLIHSLQEIQPDSLRNTSVIFISIDPKEGPDLALAKKRTYLKRFGRKEAAKQWHFLTGSSASIQRIAQEVGFPYRYDRSNDQYAHPSGIVVLTPGGKVSKYLFGVTFPPAEVDAALKEAGRGASGVQTAPFLMLCSKFMTLTGKHSAAVMLSVRILAVLLIFGITGLIVLNGRRRKGVSA